jgi:hypothetical protein
VLGSFPTGSKINALARGSGVEGSGVRSDSRGSGVAGSFSQCAFASIDNGLSGAGEPIELLSVLSGDFQSFDEILAEDSAGTNSIRTFRSQLERKEKSSWLNRTQPSREENRSTAMSGYTRPTGESNAQFCRRYVGRLFRTRSERSHLKIALKSQSHCISRTRRVTSTLGLVRIASSLVNATLHPPDAGFTFRNKASQSTFGVSGRVKLPLKSAC